MEKAEVAIKEAQQREGVFSSRGLGEIGWHLICKRGEDELRHGQPSQLMNKGLTACTEVQSSNTVHNVIREMCRGDLCHRLGRVPKA